MDRLKEMYAILDNGGIIKKHEYIEFIFLSNNVTGKNIKRKCVNGVKQAYLQLREYNANK